MSLALKIVLYKYTSLTARYRTYDLCEVSHDVLISALRHGWGWSGLQTS